MGVCVRLILPDRDEGAQGEILDRIADRWEGVTVTQGFGLWDTPKKSNADVTNRHREPVLVVWCSIPEWSDAAHAWWGDLARSACILFGETCIMWSRQQERAWLTYSSYTESI